MENYIEINKALWNEKTKHHVASAFYNMESFLAGASSLKEIELDLLGDVAGKTLLHLQCHFGQDTLSLARMGAKATGVDFSDRAIDKARELNTQLGLNADFICSDVYALADVHDEQYDIVFTSYGTIGWLPDMARWAGVVARFLKPGGRFVFVDFHPVVWMFSSDFSRVQFSYFNREPIVETLEGTYADRSADIAMKEVGWNHDLAEVLQALLTAGLSLQGLHEYDHSPFNCFSNMTEAAPGRWQIKGLEGRLPMVYALQFVKPGAAS